MSEVIVDWIAHAKDPWAHHHGHWGTVTNASSDNTITCQVPVDQPDLLGTALVPMLDIHANFAPNGIRIITVKILTSESSTYSVTFQIRDTTDDGSPTTIATVATAASTEAETSVLTNDTATVGQKIYASLPATDVGQLVVEVNFVKN